MKKLFKILGRAMIVCKNGLATVCALRFTIQYLKLGFANIISKLFKVVFSSIRTTGTTLYSIRKKQQIPLYKNLR